MPQERLLDFCTVDLSRDVVSRERIREVCRQRGRMEMLDGILHFDLPGQLVVGYKDIRADDWWAPDHIPGRPIFPGALQVEGAAQLCTFDFMHRRAERTNVFVGFAGLNDTRFRSVIEPPSRLVWAAKLHKLRGAMFTYRTQGFVGEKLVFESEIMGVVL